MRVLFLLKRQPDYRLSLGVLKHRNYNLTIRWIYVLYVLKHVLNKNGLVENLNIFFNFCQKCEMNFNK